MKLAQFKQQALSLIHQRLDELLLTKPAPYKNLFEAASYSLLSSGKRLRPLLLLTTLHSYQVPLQVGIDPACAIECIHTYSLIHDDLPSMDNDDFRRGRPSLHKVFPESIAILAGDFLLTYAFEILSQAPHCTSEQKIELIRSLSHRAGAHGMIGGQVMDLNSQELIHSWDNLYLVHLYKTAALITSCLECGGILAHCSNQDLKLLQTCGQALGIAYQMLDDLQDEEADHFASQLHVDKKITSITLLGREKTKEYIKKFMNKALESAQALSASTLLLEELIKDIISVTQMEGIGRH